MVSERKAKNIAAWITSIIRAMRKWDTTDRIYDAIEKGILQEIRDNDGQRKTNRRNWSGNLDGRIQDMRECRGRYGVESLRDDNVDK